jgi:hypothetical protein
VYRPRRGHPLAVSIPAESGANEPAIALHHHLAAIHAALTDWRGHLPGIVHDRRVPPTAEEQRARYRILVTIQVPNVTGRFHQIVKTLHE